MKLTKYITAYSVILVSLLQQVYADHGASTDCYTCGTGGDDVYMCDWGNFLPDYHIICCKEGITSKFCKATDQNKCSPTKKVAGPLFYTYCPGIDATMCGSETDNMALLSPGTGYKTFYWEGMKLSSGKGWKKSKFDSCYY